MTRSDCTNITGTGEAVSHQSRQDCLEWKSLPRAQFEKIYYQPPDRLSEKRYHGSISCFVKKMPAKWLSSGMINYPSIHPLDPRPER